MKETNFYLWKLKYFKGNKIRKKHVDVNNMPDDIHYSKVTGRYTKIDTDRPINEESERFIRIKNAYNLNVIRVCVVVCTVFLVLAIVSII